MGCLMLCRKINFLVVFLAIVLIVVPAYAQQNITLEDSLRLAFENNSELKIKRAKVEVARGEKQKKSALFPSGPRLGLDTTTDSVFKNEGMLGVEASLSQEIEVAGQRGLRKKVGTLGWEKSKTQLQWFENQLRAEVRVRFYEILYLQQRRDVLQNVVSTNQTLSRFANQRRDQGVLSPFESRLWNMDYANAVAELNVTKADLESARANLAWLMGIDVQTLGRLVGDLPRPKRVLTKTDLAGAAYARRADFKSAILNVEETEKTYRLSKRSLIPNPEVSLGIVHERDVIEGGEFDGNSAITGALGENRSTDHKLRVGMSLTLPLFSGARGEVTKTKALHDIARYKKQNLETRIAADVTRTQKSLLLAQETVARYVNSGAGFGSDLQLLKDAYQKGNIDADTYLNRRDRLVTARLNYLDSRWMISKHQAELELVSGTDGERIP